jgi:hypothetical protein
MRRAIAVAFPVIAAVLPHSALTAQVGTMRVSLPSPTAATLGKFGDIPVSLYTGTPDITIPLFTAKGKTLELPISLKYHAGGIRVQEIGGWIGIGWALDVGGTITRTVHGLVDESSGGYYNSGWQWYVSGNWPTPPNSIIDLMTSEQLDGEPDQFFFSFAGRSGQFVIGPTSSSQSLKEYRAVPYQKLLIQPAGDFSYWDITTEDGTRYRFGAVESNTDYNTTYPGGEIPAHYGEAYKSSWHLTEIRAPGGDVITLSYTPYTARHRLTTYREQFSQIVVPDPETSCVPDYFDVINEYEVSGQRLDSITTAAHVIKFKTSLRTDALNPNTNAQQEPRLDTIIVKTPGNVVLRKFVFDYDYSAGRLTLKNVYELDRNNASLPPYSFTYGGPTLPAISSYSVDHYGFYNGKSNSGYIPTVVTTAGSVLAGADRNPDSAYARAGVLTRITYPTGGYNEFVYEVNDYGGIGAPDQMPKVEGPPQSVNAVSNDWQGLVSTPFTVGGTDSVILTVSVGLSPSDCGQQIGCPYSEVRKSTGEGIGTWTAPGTYYVRVAPGNYNAWASSEMSGGYATTGVSWRDIAPGGKKLGGGLRVAEVRTADAMGTITTRKYKYTRQSDATRSSGMVGIEPAYTFQYTSSGCSYFSASSMSKMPLGGGASVGYSEVTVWHGPNGEYGKTRHTFRSVVDQVDLYPWGVWPFSTPTSKEWKRGQETEAVETNAAGQTQQRAASTYSFQDYEPETWRSFRGMSIHPFSAGTLLGGSAYYYNSFNVFSAWSYKDSDTTVFYNDTGSSSFTTTRTYAYGNPKHIELTELTETNSNGTQRITRMKYPADYANTGTDAVGAALAAMQGSAHMHSPVIERVVIEKVGSTEKIVQAELTTFKQYLTGQYLPYQRFVLNAPGAIP